MRLSKVKSSRLSGKTRLRRAVALLAVLFAVAVVVLIVLRITVSFRHRNAGNESGDSGRSGSSSGIDYQAEFEKIDRIRSAENESQPSGSSAEKTQSEVIDDLSRTAAGSGVPSYDDSGISSKLEEMDSVSR